MNQAMNILLNGKTDTELLDALVFALTEGDNAALTEYASMKRTTTKDGANIELVRHICRYVLWRSKSVPAQMNDETTGIFAEAAWNRNEEVADE